MKGLDVLLLNRNQLEGTIPASFAQLSDLGKLHVSLLQSAFFLFYHTTSNTIRVIVIIVVVTFSRCTVVGRE